MTTEEQERELKEVKNVTLENTLAIRELIIVSKQTLKDIDKVAGAMNDHNILKERLSYMDENAKESFDRVHKKNSTTEADCKANTDAINKMPSATTVRWISGFLIVYLIAFGIYVISSIHHNDNQITYLKGRIKK